MPRRFAADAGDARGRGSALASLACAPVPLARLPRPDIAAVVAAVQAPVPSGHRDGAIRPGEKWRRAMAEQTGGDPRMTNVVSMRDRPVTCGTGNGSSAETAPGSSGSTASTRWGNPFRITEGLSRTQASRVLPRTPLAAHPGRQRSPWRIWPPSNRRRFSAGAARGSPATATYWRERLSGPPSSLGG